MVASTVTCRSLVLYRSQKASSTLTCWMPCFVACSSAQNDSESKTSDVKQAWNSGSEETGENKTSRPNLEPRDVTAVRHTSYRQHLREASRPQAASRTLTWEQPGHRQNTPGLHLDQNRPQTGHRLSELVVLSDAADSAVHTTAFERLCADKDAARSPLDLTVRSTASAYYATDRNGTKRNKTNDPRANNSATKNW